MSANPKYLALGDIVRKGWNLSVQCKCGHTGAIDAAKLDRWYNCHGWSTNLARVRGHLYCLGCGGIPEQAYLRATVSSPTAPRGRFPSNEDGWTRLVRGLRNS